jgi:hypothetical protein
VEELLMGMGIGKWYSDNGTVKFQLTALRSENNNINSNIGRLFGLGL